MKIALTCMDIQWEDKSVNRDKCVKLIKRASDYGARLILFPEMTLTGFTHDTDTFAEEIDSSGMTETVRFFAEQSRKENIAVGFGYIRKNNQSVKAKNMFAVVDQGIVLGEYEKMHPFSYGEENLYYEGGDSLVSVQIDDINFGLFICYDLRFPEIFQKSSERNEVMAVIANWPSSRDMHWNCLLQARAIETQSVVLGVNRKGNGNGLKYSKSSGAFDSAGLPVLIDEQRIEPYQDEIMFCDVDPVQVKKQRDKFPFKEDRRKNIYKIFY